MIWTVRKTVFQFFSSERFSNLVMRGRFFVVVFSLEQVSISSLLWRRRCFSQMCILFRRMPLRLKSIRSGWCFCRIYYKNRAFLGVWIKQRDRILRYCSVRKWYIICYVKWLMDFSDQQHFLCETLPSPEQLTETYSKETNKQQQQQRKTPRPSHPPTHKRRCHLSAHPT